MGDSPALSAEGARASDDGAFAGVVFRGGTAGWAESFWHDGRFRFVVVQPSTMRLRKDGTPGRRILDKQNIYSNGLPGQDETVYCLP